MKFLRSVFISFLLAICCQVSANGYGYLCITQTAGQTNFTVSDIKNITFDESNMLINLTDGSQEKLPLSGLTKMFFTGEPTGVQRIGTSHSAFTIKDGVLHVKDANGTHVTIYDMNGKAVRDVTLQQSETEMNLSGLTRGVYIVKVGSQAKKITNK